MIEISRTIIRNRQMDEGPRREKGYRAIVETLGPDLCATFGIMGKLQKRFAMSPLFAREELAQAWQPEIEATAQ